MANTHETIADIIAWLRKPIEGENAYLTLWRDEISDRIEAALKRERGDRAKLREALSKSCAYFAVVLNTGMFNRVHLEALLNMAKGALAAPAMNCDSYDSADEMMEKYADDAFLEEWKKWRETGKCHPLMLDAFLCINWLFLTNEKGETNGSK